MPTVVSIFQLILLTKMLTFFCSAMDVYLSTESRTWDASRLNNCNLAKSGGNITLNDVVPRAPVLAWVDETTCSNRRVWINMTGCFNFTSVSNRSIHIPDGGSEDPVVFCLRECDSDKVYLTSTECHCSKDETVTRDSRCQGSRCGRYNDRLCGSGVNDGTKCVCGYEKTNISINESGYCMSTKVSNGDFVYKAQNCSQLMPALCTNSENKPSISPRQITNWTLASCSTGSYFIGVKNGGNVLFNIDTSLTLWIGLFRIDLPQKTCMAINITNYDHTVIQKDCSQKLPSLCINQTATTSTKTPARLTSRLIATFQGTTSSLMTGYTSTSTVVSQTHSSPKDQASKAASATTSPDVITQATTKCDNLSSGYADNTETTTTTSITVSTKRDPANETDDRFPTLAVGFGAGGAVVFILVLSILVVCYRRRNQSQRGVTKLYDGNPTITQQTRTMKKDSNGHAADNIVLSNIDTDHTQRRAGLEDYDHLETHKNRKSRHNHERQAEAFHNNTYDHVGHHEQDGSAYNTFSQKNESVASSEEEYDHIGRDADLYDHMGTEPVTSPKESDYDHTKNWGRKWSGNGRHGTGKGYNSNIAPKIRTTLHVHHSNEGNHDNDGGNGQSQTLNTDKTRNSHDKHYTGAQCVV